MSDTFSEGVGATDGGAETQASGSTDFTPDQIRQMAEWAVEDGSMSREQASAALQADGQQSLGAPSKAEGPAAEIDAAFPPAEPQHYEIPPLVDSPEQYTREVAELDQLFRGWLSDAGFTREIGSAVAKEIDRVATEWEGMDDAQRELWQQTQWVQLENMWGDRLDQKLALARQLVAELEQASPGIVTLLDESGASNSAFVVAQMALQAERLLARQGR